MSSNWLFFRAFSCISNTSASEGGSIHTYSTLTNEDDSQKEGHWVYTNLSRGSDINEDQYFSPCGLCVGLGLSSTIECISGWSRTTIRGGRSLLRIWVPSWLTADARFACSFSSSLSVSEASPGTWQKKASYTFKTGDVCELCFQVHKHTLLYLWHSQ